FAPAIIRIERTEHWMALAAEQMHSSLVSPQPIFQQSPDVCFPNFSFLLRKYRQVHKISNIDLAIPILRAAQPLFEPMPFPTTKLAPLRGGLLPHVRAPIEKVLQQPEAPKRSPGNARVPRVWRRAIH